MTTVLYYASMVIVIAALIVILWLTVPFIISRMEMMAFHRKYRRKRCCETCYYHKDGRCIAVRPDDCTENDLVFWLPKEEDEC